MMALALALPALLVFGYLFPPSAPGQPSRAVTATLLGGLTIPAACVLLSVFCTAFRGAYTLVLGFGFAGACSGVLVLGSAVRLGGDLFRRDRRDDGGDFRRFLRGFCTLLRVSRRVQSKPYAGVDPVFKVALKQLQASSQLPGRHRLTGDDRRR